MKTTDKSVSLTGDETPKNIGEEQPGSNPFVGIRKNVFGSIKIGQNEKNSDKIKRDPGDYE